MGLNSESNYSVLYNELTVANEPEHLGGPGANSRGVTRLGSIHQTDLFGRILQFRDQDEYNFGLGMRDSSKVMELIEDFGLCDRTEKHVAVALARQDHAEEERQTPLPNLATSFPENSH